MQTKEKIKKYGVNFKTQILSFSSKHLVVRWEEEKNVEKER